MLYNMTGHMKRNCPSVKGGEMKLSEDDLRNSEGSDGRLDIYLEQDNEVKKKLIIFLKMKCT